MKLLGTLALVATVFAINIYAMPLEVPRDFGPMRAEKGVTGDIDKGTVKFVKCSVEEEKGITGDIDERSLQVEKGITGDIDERSLDVEKGITGDIDERSFK